MNHTYNIKKRMIILAMLGIACFAFAPSVSFGGWVGETMCACPGLAKPLGNNASCEDACYGIRSSPGGGNATPSYDYGAAQRARDAEAERQRQAEAERVERERLAEEKRQKDAKFIRDRDAAANTLKGSSSPAINQLKGLSGTDSFGLKGSGFDTGSAGLKELRGSEPVAEKTSSQAETKQTSKEVCRPSQDPAVVDLCFLEDRPAVIDPLILKGMNPAERTALKTSVQNMMVNLLPFDKKIYQAIADIGADSAKTGKQWPGPKNPGARLLNPLSEPDQVKAYWDIVNAGLQVQAEAEAKIVTAALKGMDWRDLVARQDTDPKFRQSKELIIRNQDKAEGLARQKMFIKFRDFLEKQGGDNWPERIKNDKLFFARMVMEREALFKKMDQEIYSVRAKALQQMTILVREWKEK